MKQKKGATHIEFIISFVIFIGFLIFLFAFLKPVRNTEISMTILDSAQRGIEEYAKVDYGYITLNVLNDLEQGKTCFSIDLAMNNIIVRDKTNKDVESGGGNRVSIRGGKGFYTIYQSSEFDASSPLTDCDSLSQENNDYTLGLLRKTKVLSENKLDELKNKYFNDEEYKNLKSQFNIPDGNDFGFSVREANGNILIEIIRKKPPKISIIARDVPAQLLKKVNDEWKIEYIIMNIQAW